MKKAFYEVVKTEEEKYRRIRELKEAHKGDTDFYSAYIDVDIRYNESISRRKGFQSLMNAIRKKKVDTIFIPSFEAFRISEMYALNILLRFKNRGIKIQIGTGNKEISNSVSEEEIDAKMRNLYEDYLLTSVSVHMITMEECFVLSGPGVPFLFLEKDKDQAGKRYSYAKAEKGKKELFIDVVEKYRNEGFFFFRSDVDEWYFIDAYGVEVLSMIYEINNEIMWDTVFKSFQE